MSTVANGQSSPASFVGGSHTSAQNLSFGTVAITAGSVEFISTPTFGSVSSDGAMAAEAADTETKALNDKETHITVAPDQNLTDVFWETLLETENKALKKRLHILTDAEIEKLNRHEIENISLKRSVHVLEETINIELIANLERLKILETKWILMKHCLTKERTKNTALEQRVRDLTEETQNLKTEKNAV